MIRDKWVYQKRQVQNPWAIYLVAEYDRLTGRTQCLDATFYCEDIGNAEHSYSVVGLQAHNISGYVNDLATILLEFSIVDHSDIKQLESELANFIS